MKRICFFIGNLDHSGGTERVTTLIANEFAKLKGYQVTILNLSGGNNPFFKIDRRIKIERLYSSKVSFKSNFIGCVWKLRKFVLEQKIDNFIDVDSIMCVFSVPAFWGLKINHICWEHFNFNVNLGIRFRDIGRKIAAKYCNYIVTLTNRDKELWKKGLSKINAEIRVITNPTPFEGVCNTPSLDNKVVLAIGRLTFQKGFDLLITAWADVCKVNKDWVLHIVGSGEDENSLKKLAKQLSVLDRIKFISATQNVEYYFRSASLYCLSSRFEGLGMVMLEAQSFGLPIVAFDCDAGPADLVKDQVNGLLVENGNLDKLSKSILQMINLDKEEYNAMVAKSFSNSNNFHVDILLNKWIELIV